MEYERYYTSLWNELTSLVKSTDSTTGTTDYTSISTKIPGFEAAINSCESKISTKQWQESLGVAACFNVTGFPWTTPQTVQYSNKWITVIANHLGLAINDEIKINKQLFQIICVTHIQPCFITKSNNTSYSLLSDGQQGNRMVDQHRFQDEQKWKTTPQCIATFTWILEHLCDPIIDCISLMLPVILNLVEDYDTRWKIKGIEFAKTMVSRGDDKFMRTSGIAEMLDKSLQNSLILRSDEGQQGMELLDSAYSLAIQTAKIQYTNRDSPKYTDHWWKLVDRLITNNTYAGDNITAISIICKQITPLCQALGLAITRYLRPLIGMLTGPLHSPVYLGIKVYEMHRVVVDQLLVLCGTCVQRLRIYCTEIVAALAYSWDRCMSDKCKDVIPDGVGGFQDCIIQVLDILHGSCPDETQRAVTKLISSSPVFEEWRNVINSN